MSDDDRTFMDKVLGRDEPRATTSATDTRDRPADEFPAPRDHGEHTTGHHTEHPTGPTGDHTRRDDMRVVDVPRGDAPHDADRGTDPHPTDPDRTDPRPTDSHRTDSHRTDPHGTHAHDAVRDPAPADDTWREPTPDTDAGPTSDTDSAPGRTDPHPDAQPDSARRDQHDGGSYSDRLGARDPQAQTGEQAVALVPTDRAEDYRHRWEGLKASFVDEPRGAVRVANELVGHVLDDVAELFATQRADLERDLRNEEADTEQLRQALNRYRAFFDRLLTL
ncbi:hypothetical protein [Pseudonocardia oroxyli]|uniref:Uncharacterized protein n=1 Tax=Pseudonocardia oroxyli TaxID=366584 RepID=A0A1G7I5R6_PSEOR|nr:hypothetical protein [Pseudonocardia oroxyli]SDF08065.1 hypothetical protein SAMN05216377_103216 [Pseudonocardia oroxyli]